MRLAQESAVFEGLRSLDSLIWSGEVREARTRLRELELVNGAGAAHQLRVAERYTLLGQHADALRCCEYAASLEPMLASARYNLATALIAVGRIEQAEDQLDQLIAQHPADYDAWYNRSTLRRQTASRNHIKELSHLVRHVCGTRAEVPVCYALAKELEDLGEYQRSFALLKRGAERRRLQLSYRVETDVAAMAEVAQVFDEKVCRAADVRLGPSDPGPIFIVGLPRSGTTLVDRILSSHPHVESLGELNDFAWALVQQLGSSNSKGDLIRHSAAADFHALGQEYLRRTAGRRGPFPRFIDKTPSNFLYVGLLCLSLPGARIIHVRRGAMDSCYAMYKTLFRMGYPYSYSLGDLARYYLAYDRLMRHWIAVLPGRIVEVEYETLVSSQESETRRLLAECGLSFEHACLRFHENTAPAATASAAQVRRPLYSSSVGLWHRYSSELAPLAEALCRQGVLLEPLVRMARDEERCVV